MPEIALTHFGYLAGAGLIAAPILIHILNRMRFRTVRWAPMEFLLEARRKNRRRVLLEQLILLLLRILIVLLVVLLVARPYVSSRLAAFLGAGRTHDIVLLDDSCSMLDHWADTNAFQQAKRAVLQLAQEAAGRGGAHEMTLLRLSSPSRPDFLRQPVEPAFLSRFERHLETMACTHGAYHPLPGVQEAQRLFDEDKRLNRSLHLLSDFRARDWQAEESLARTLIQLAQDETGLNFIQCVSEPHANISVRSLGFTARNAAANVPTGFQVTIQNHSLQASESLDLALRVDGRALPSVKFDPIGPGESATQSFDVVFDRAGSHALQVELPQDALAPDNTRSLILTIRDRIDVLLVNGDQNTRQVDYVAYALAPGGHSLTGIEPSIRGPETLSTDPLDRYQMIYLVNVSELPAPAVKALDAAVRKGAGLVLFLGDLVNTTFYNQSLHQAGSGLFPAPLLSPTDIEGLPVSGMGQIQFENHPVFGALAGERNPFIQNVRVKRLFLVSTDWKPGQGTQVVARLQSGEPFILEKELGNGRVMAFLSGVDPRWNTWTKNPSFVITMLQVQALLARPGLAAVALDVGQPLTLEFPGHEYQREVTILYPGNENPVSVTASPKEGDPAVQKVTIPAALFSGVYAAVLAPVSGPPERRLSAFNVPPDESDLRLLSRSDLGERLKGVPFRFQEMGDLKWFDPSSEHQELLDLVVATLLLGLVLEQFLAYRWSYHPRAGQGRGKPR